MVAQLRLRNLSQQRGYARAASHKVMNNEINKTEPIKDYAQYLDEAYRSQAERYCKILFGENKK